MSEEKNSATVALGKLRRKAGKAPAEKLTREQSSELAREAAKGQWVKKRREEGES
jgi:hypothetical protein